MANNGTSLIEAMHFSWNYSPIEIAANYKQSLLVSDIFIFTFATLLGIGSLDKLHAKLTILSTVTEYDDYISTKSQTNPRNESVILIVNGEMDNPVDPQTYKQVEEQSNYKIVFAKVKELKDISTVIADLKRSSNQIKGLWIRAHGTPTSIHFSEY